MYRISVTVDKIPFRKYIYVPFSKQGMHWSRNLICPCSQRPDCILKSSSFFLSRPRLVLIK